MVITWPHENQGITNLSETVGCENETKQYKKTSETNYYLKMIHDYPHGCESINLSSIKLMVLGVACPFPATFSS